MVSPDKSTPPQGATISADERALQSRIDHAIDEERLRISRDLHDHTAQQATIVKLRLQRAKSFPERSSFIHEIDKAIADVDVLINGLHDIVEDLRHGSLENSRFLEILRDYATEWSSNYDIPVDIVIGQRNPNIKHDVAQALLYVTREALVNIKNHALNVSHVTVSLQCTDDDIMLTIDDNGVGFDLHGPTQPESQARGRRLGLVGMRERLALVGGNVEVTSERGSGTRIQARVGMESRST